MKMGVRFSKGRRNSIRAAIGGAALAVVLGTIPPTAGAQNGVPANWQRQKLMFNYLGISPTYSCEGMRDTLTFLLSQSGAKLNTPVETFPCGGGAGGGAGAPSSLISARLDFSVLQPGQDTAGSGAAVTGVWRHVDFSLNHSSPQLQGADCELVQEFQQQVLTKFVTRNVHANLRCIPHQTTGNQFDLSFDVLTSSASHGVGGADRG